MHFRDCANYYIMPLLLRHSYRVLSQRLMVTDGTTEYDLTRCITSTDPACNTTRPFPCLKPHVGCGPSPSPALLYSAVGDAFQS